MVGPADRHAYALENLKAVMGPNPPAACLECHSADYSIAPDDAKPTGAEAKYGITCVGCHTPHEKGTAKGAWNEEFTPQLRYRQRRRPCASTCHNAELDGKVATPGSTVHHPMKEMMNGTGAIDVPQGSPSVHKGKCVQCHMPPTTISRGSVQLGANHTFKIIEPEVGRRSHADPGPHDHAAPALAGRRATPPCRSRPAPPATAVRTTRPLRGCRTRSTDRQEAMHAWNDQVTAALTKAAKRLGFKSTAAANTAINKKPMKKWTKGQMAFQKAFTNQTYVVAKAAGASTTGTTRGPSSSRPSPQARSVKK